MHSLTKAAFEQYLASAEARQAAQIVLIAETATTTWRWARTASACAWPKDTLQAQQASLDLARGRFKAGVASELDLRQAETTVDQARALRLHHPGGPDRPVDLYRQRRLSRAVEVDGEGGHGAMVQSFPPILVLYYDRKGHISGPVDGRTRFTWTCGPS